MNKQTKSEVGPKKTLEEIQFEEEIKNLALALRVAEIGIDRPGVLELVIKIYHLVKEFGNKIEIGKILDLKDQLMKSEDLPPARLKNPQS